MYLKFTGDFEVSINGQLVFSKQKKRAFPVNEAVSKEGGRGVGGGEAEMEGRDGEKEEGKEGEGERVEGGGRGKGGREGGLWK